MRLTTLRPKGTKSGCNGFFDVAANGHRIFCLLVAPKVFKIIRDVELGKPYMSLKR
jgi:hypothetical protein